MAPTLIDIAIPKEYGYVLLTVASSFVISTWHGVRVGGFRGRAKIPYPQFYASPAQISAATSVDQKEAMLRFNCAQRAHGNFQEHYPVFLAGVLVSGLKYPVASAALGALWVVSRVFYATGYTSGKENGRGRYNGGLGMLWHISFVGYLGLVAKMGYDLITA